MKKLLLAGVMSLVFMCGYSAVVDSIFYKFSLTKTQLDSMLTANGVPAAFVGTIYDIDVYKVRYKTVGLDSGTIFATGMLAFPTNADCKLPLGTYGHGTISHKEQVPSRANGLEGVIGMIVASVGYVSTLPDYIGLGDAPVGLLHPYQDARTEASATIDLMRAARELAPQLNYRLNGQVFITGYSQGGHTTMATYKTIQEKLKNEFTVTAACPMSGPYDLSGVMVDVMLSDSDYAVPGYLPYLVFGWNQRYHFYNSPKDYLRAPYDSTLPPLFDGYHDMGQINAAMPRVPKLIFKQEMIDSFTNNPNHPFRQALADNDVYNWKPDSAVRILFCRSDEEVSPRNAFTLYNTFKANGAAYVDTICVDETVSHFECAQQAILYMKLFFADYKRLDSCAATVRVNEVAQHGFSLYPNPANNQLTLGFEGVTTLDNVVAINSLGQAVTLPFTQSTYLAQMDIKDLPAGVYFLRASFNGKLLAAGRFVKAE